LRKIHRARRMTIKQGLGRSDDQPPGAEPVRPDSEAMKTKAVNTRAELCQMLAECLAKSWRALQETTEDHLTKLWRFRMND
jgi:hypothetical protein